MSYLERFMPIAIVVGIAAGGYPSTSAAAGAETCLQQHVGKLDALLTLERVAPYVQSAPQEVEADYDSEHTHEISYSWPGGRTRTMDVAGNEMTFPRPDIISLGGIKSYTESDYYDRDEDDPVERFERGHHNMTAEERENARAAINENMKDESETTRKIANKLLGAATARVMFEPVEDIGDAAAWNLRTKELDVLVGETEFSVSVDISADKEENKAAATKLAHSILSDCTDTSDGG